MYVMQNRVSVVKKKGGYENSNDLIGEAEVHAGVSNVFRVGKVVLALLMKTSACRTQVKMGALTF